MDISSSNPATGFVWFLLIGFIFGIRDAIKGSWTSMIAASIYRPLVCSHKHFPTSNRCNMSLLLLLYSFFSKIVTLRDNILLLLIGALLYIALFFIPHLLRESLSDYLGNGLLHTAIFTAGSLVMFGIYSLFAKLGYEKDRVSIYVFGLPGFVIFFCFTLWHSFGGSDQ